MRRTIAARVRGIARASLEESLERQGWALVPGLLTAAECDTLVRLYPDDRHFRKRIDMERHRFGVGDYAYFAHPLPALVRELRTHLYRRLAPVANAWASALGEARRFPPSLRPWIARCHEAGQTRPTPLVLRYRAGGYNRLHQDLYGELAFPLQAAIFLSRPGADYAGGAFLLVEQRPREQARAEALAPGRGDLVVFANAVRPASGRRGSVRTNVRHGVATVTRGSRYALGVIFHDAR
jgi:hypothetical protein